MIKLRRGSPKTSIVPGVNLLPGRKSTNIADDPSIVYARAATLGFATGLRSLTPLALLSWLQADKPSKSKDSVETLLDHPAVRITTALLALGELVGDKLPIIPSRLKPGPLTGRLLIGSLAGMSISHQYRQSLLLGALLGIGGAAAGSFMGYYGRTTLANATRIPQGLWGIAEDGLAIYLSSLAISPPNNDNR
ncbi:MAG: DUF4126 family protein [Ktedonobacteraceae bacterium]|jgi:uncharacterized membrane protein